MSDSIQKQYNIKFGVEIEMISPYEKAAFINTFNKTARQFLLPISVAMEDSASVNDWQLKMDSSITTLAKNIDTKAWPTKIPAEKFPEQKIVSQPSNVGYRKGEQMFLPIKEPKEVTEARLLDRKPTFQVGDEEIKFRKMTEGGKFELISPPLAFTESNIDQVKWVISILKRMRMKVNGSTGLHIHVSHNDMDLFNFIKMLKNVDEKMIKKLWPTRFNTTYTHSKEKIVDVVKSHLQKLFEKESDTPISNADLNNIFDVANNIWERYFGINIQAFKVHGTIEFRYAGSELREEKMIGWLKYIRELVINSITQNSVEIGEFKIVKKEGMFSVFSKFHEGVEITSTSIIDQFSRKENREKGIKLFLQEKGLLDDYQELVKQIRSYDRSGRNSNNEILEKNKQIENLVYFFKELIKIKPVKEIMDLLARTVSNDTEIYMIKEFVNDGIASLDEFMDLNDQGFTGNDIKLISSLNADALNKIPLDKLKIIYKNFVKSGYTTVVLDILKKLDKKKLEDVLLNDESHGSIALELILTEVNNIDNLKNDISDDTMLNIFSKENIKKLSSSKHLVTILIRRLLSSSSAISTKIVNNIDIADYKDFRRFSGAMSQIFGEILNYQKQNTNIKNLQIIKDKFLSAYDEKKNNDDKEIFDEVNFYHKLFTNKLEYDDVINQFGSEQNTFVTISMKNFIMDNRPKLGMFVMVVGSSRSYILNSENDILEVLKDKNTREETVSSLKRFFKTVVKNKKLNDKLYAATSYLKLDEFYKQEYFNNIKLDATEMESFLSFLDSDFFKESDKKFLDLLLGVEQNRKEFVTYETFYILTDIYQNSEFREYVIDILQNSEQNYEEVSKKIYDFIVNNYTNFVARLINFFENPESLPFIDFEKLKISLKNTINRHYSRFLEHIIANAVISTNEQSASNTQKIIEILGYDNNAAIKFVTSSKKNDEMLKDFIVKYQEGDVTTKEIMKMFLEKFTPFINNSSYSFLKDIKSTTLILQLISIGSKENLTSNQGLSSILFNFFKYKKELPDSETLDKIKTIGKNVLNSLFYNIGDSYSEFVVVKWLNDNYEQFKKHNLWSDVCQQIPSYISIITKVYESNIEKVKWKKSYTEYPDDIPTIPASAAIPHKVMVLSIHFTHTKLGKINVIFTYHKIPPYTKKEYLVTLGIPEKNVSISSEIIKTIHKLSGISAGRMVGDLLDGHNYSNLFEEDEIDSLKTLIEIIYDKNFRYSADGEDEEEDEGSLMFNSSKKKEENNTKPEEIVHTPNSVQEEINHNKKFKELLLNEGIKKAKLFLMKNKDKITDRKLISISKRMGV